MNIIIDIKTEWIWVKIGTKPTNLLSRTIRSELWANVLLSTNNDLLDVKMKLIKGGKCTVEGRKPDGSNQNPYFQVCALMPEVRSSAKWFKGWKLKLNIGPDCKMYFFRLQIYLYKFTTVFALNSWQGRFKDRPRRVKTKRYWLILKNKTCQREAVNFN